MKRVANQQQLAILKQGVNAWNAWRQGHRVPPELSGADLTGANLEHTTLWRAKSVGCQPI